MTHDPMCPNPLAAKTSCHCALIAKVREDERVRLLTLTDKVKDAQYAKGQRDEREAIAQAVTADLTARMQREREDRDPDLLLGGIDYALQNVLRVIRARGEKQFRFATRVECVHQFEVFDQIDGGKHAKCVLCGFKEKS